MRYQTDDYIILAESKALDNLSNDFADECRAKLYGKMQQGRVGWDDPAWPIAEIKDALIEHIEKGDPVDVANFAMFWWNRMQEGAADDKA